jgi:hypothetical protein
MLKNINNAEQSARDHYNDSALLQSVSEYLAGGHTRYKSSTTKTFFGSLYFYILAALLYFILQQENFIRCSNL